MSAQVFAFQRREHGVSLRQFSLLGPTVELPETWRVKWRLHSRKRDFIYLSLSQCSVRPALYFLKLAWKS